MTILDTDIISLLDAQSGEAYENLERRLSASDVGRFCVTIISFEEQMRGWLSYIAASRAITRQVEGYARLQGMLEWYHEQETLAFNMRAAEIFEQFRRSRIRIGTMDLKIAAIVHAHGALLVSRNAKDFERIPNLRVEDWTKPA